MDVMFTPVRFRVGYSMEEVDDFLDRCDRALATGDGSLTAQAVTEARFRTTRFEEAYDMDEVDRFLDDVLVPRFRALDGQGAPAAKAPAAQAPAPSERTTAPVESRGGPAVHPAEQRGGFLSRLFRGR